MTESKDWGGSMEGGALGGGGGGAVSGSWPGPAASLAILPLAVGI